MLYNAAIRSRKNLGLIIKYSISIQNQSFLFLSQLLKQLKNITKKSEWSVATFSIIANSNFL